jgi:hypothetical protein
MTMSNRPVDDPTREALAALDADVAAAAVVYENDFGAMTTQGRSRGPQGRGTLAADIDSMVAFRYRVVVDTLADGTRGARFPTGVEQPGGGPGYSWFGSYVCGRRRALDDVTAWAFTVIVPRHVDVTNRCSYYENRFVASVDVEDRESLLGVRFDGDDELIWVRGLNVDPKHPSPGAVVDRIPLGARLVGGERLRCIFAVDVRAGRAVFGVRCAERSIDVAVVSPAVVDLSRADAILVSSSGNTISSDDDPGLFFRIADVVVTAAPRAQR